MLPKAGKGAASGAQNRVQYIVESFWDKKNLNEDDVLNVGLNNYNFLKEIYYEIRRIKLSDADNCGSVCNNTNIFDLNGDEVVFKNNIDLFHNILVEYYLLISDIDESIKLILENIQYLSNIWQRYSNYYSGNLIEGCLCDLRHR